MEVTHGKMMEKPTVSHGKMENQQFFMGK